MDRNFAVLWPTETHSTINIKVRFPLSIISLGYFHAQKQNFFQLLIFNPSKSFFCRNILESLFLPTIIVLFINNTSCWIMKEKIKWPCTYVVFSSDVVYVVYGYLSIIAWIRRIFNQHWNSMTMSTIWDYEEKKSLVKVAPPAA